MGFWSDRPHYDIDPSFTSGDLKAIIEPVATGVLTLEPAEYDLSERIIVPHAARLVTDDALINLLTEDAGFTFEDRDESTAFRNFRFDGHDRRNLQPVIFGLTPAWDAGEGAWLPRGSGSKALLYENLNIKRLGTGSTPVTIMNIQNYQTGKLEVLDSITKHTGRSWTRTGPSAEVTDSDPHNLEIGDEVHLGQSDDATAIPGAYYTVVSVPSPTKITVTVPNAGATSGTVTLQYGAKRGLWITGGSRTGTYRSTHITGINGPCIELDTISDTRSSKHRFFGGQSEVAAGVRLLDVEKVEFRSFDVAIDGSLADDVDGLAAFHMLAGGDRDTHSDGVGDGPHGPTTLQVFGGQIQGFDSMFRAATGVGTVQTGGCLFAGEGYIYRRDVEGTTFQEIYPHITEPSGGAWHPDSVGIEAKVVRRPGGKRTVKLVEAATTLTGMVSGLVEFGGVSNWRQICDTSIVRWARLSAMVATAGAAGSVLGVALRTQSAYVVNKNGATANSFKLTVVIAGVSEETSSIAFNAAATGTGSLETKLQGLTIVGAGNVTATGSAGGPWAITFGADLEGVIVKMTVTHDTTTGGTGVTAPEGADTATDIEVAIDSTGLAVSEWTAVDETLRWPDVPAIPYSRGGNGIANPVVSQLVMELA